LIKREHLELPQEDFTELQLLVARFVQQEDTNKSSIMYSIKHAIILNFNHLVLPIS